MNFAYAFGREDDILKSPQLLRQFLGGTPESAAAAYDSASGIQLVTSASPPTLLVHGRLDTLVWHRQSERLARRLGEAGVPHLLLSLPWATHALEYNGQPERAVFGTYALAWFIQSVTGDCRPLQRRRHRRTTPAVVEGHPALIKKAAVTMPNTRSRSWRHRLRGRTVGRRRSGPDWAIVWRCSSFRTTV